MSAATRCDNCGNVSESTTPWGWLHVTTPAPTVADPMDGWDFCSSACLTIWASKHAVTEGLLP